MNTTLDCTLQKITGCYPGLELTARLVLAAAATTRLARRHPLAIILIGEPSSGKTSLLMPLTRGKKDSALRDGVIRLDDFSPASLLSHAANRTEEQLQKIDLIPKMSNRVVVVKEMAPWFSGKEDDLNKKFALFASVMDGEGLSSASGSHGRRSYDDKCLFTLLGAVTYEVMKPQVFKSMSAIGPRFNFWAMPRRNINPLNWCSPGLDRKRIEHDTQEAMVAFVDELFLTYLAESLEYDQFSFAPDLRVLLDRVACLMAMGRSRLSFGTEDGYDAAEVETGEEAPERAFFYLEQLVYASALIENRFEVRDTDLSLPIGLALGSAFTPFRKILHTLFSENRSRTIADLSAYSRMSEDTVRKYIAGLNGKGILASTNPDGTMTWDLAPAFQPLREVWLRAIGRPIEYTRSPGTSGDPNEMVQESLSL